MISQQKGDPLPALAGIPVGIKDVMVMQGAPSTAGSKILEGLPRLLTIATAVAKLEAAGAVLLGKLNCDEFAMGSSNENSAYGPVRNPVDRSACRADQRWLGGGRWARISPWPRWARTLADRFASPPVFAAWSACCPPMGASRATGSSLLLRRLTASALLPPTCAMPLRCSAFIAGHDPQGRYQFCGSR